MSLGFLSMSGSRLLFWCLIINAALSLTSTWCEDLIFMHTGEMACKFGLVTVPRRFNNNQKKKKD